MRKLMLFDIRITTIGGYKETPQAGQTLDPQRHPSMVAGTIAGDGRLQFHL